MIQLINILNEGSKNPANVKAYYEALCKNEKVTPLPVRFGNVGQGGAALTFNPKTMKALYISFNTNKMTDTEYAVIHELTHQIKLETEQDAYLGKKDQSAKFKKLENKLVEKYMYSKFSKILYKESLDEDLRKWFGSGPTGGWDRYNSKGEKAGKCGDSEKGSAYAACLSNAKASKLGKDGRASFVKRKRAAQSDAGDSKKGGEQKKGQKPTLVKTGASEGLEEKWSSKYKKSIDCSNPKGFSQKAHCAGKKKNENNMKLTVEQKMELFLEKNVPTDPAKWAASKAAAKSKFDVYPSAYANGWAAKNYKAKGGGWKTAK